jgi:Spx/MgsR family transcriptional regulator
MKTSTSTLLCIQVHGIPNCDTVKKARSWLTEHQLAYEFHDFKKQGVPEASIDHWLDVLGWETLLNRKGTTWRKLDASTQASVQDADSAKAVMMLHPSLIKRPVVEWPSHGNAAAVSVSFNAQNWSEQRL